MVSIGQLFPQNNLVLGLHLNANSNDYSGNGYNGTDSNIVYTSNGVIGGMGASFNGTSSKIALSSSLDTPLKTANFTQIFSFIMPDSGSVFGICRGRVQTTNHYGIIIQINSTTLSVGRMEGTSTSYSHDFTYTFTSGKKYIVIWTYNKSNGASVLYVCNITDKTFSKSTATLGTGNVSYHASYDEGYNLGANLRNISNQYGKGIFNEYIVFSDIKTENWIRKYFMLVRGVC